MAKSLRIQKHVSIPHSEFCSFGQAYIQARRHPHTRFNSPFGILFVRTKCVPPDARTLNWFQFPIRNSVRSDEGLIFYHPVSHPVSIPHSEFCSFGRGQARGVSQKYPGVSIPHSEFCSFGLISTKRIRRKLWSFQFPIRNSVRSDDAVRFWLAWLRLSFNSPFGILFVRTMSPAR